VCIYIFDPNPKHRRALGAASRWWLSSALKSLDEALQARGAHLLIFKGSEEKTLKNVIKFLNIKNIFWNRRYDYGDRTLDQSLKTSLKSDGLTVESFNSHLLYEPWEVVSKTGTPLKVFTPFWKAARLLKDPASPLPAPEKIKSMTWPKDAQFEPVSLSDLHFEPTSPDWAQEMRTYWSPTEEGARNRLNDFLESSLKGYAENRDRPDYDSTSRLSPFLRFGQMSPRQIWHATQHAVETGDVVASSKDLEKFFAELGWREFSYHLLFNNPELATKNYNPKFDAFPWIEKPAACVKWRRGQTGYPIVDAGMRQLWALGWMHNRVRMICASFLIKHLLIDWRHGEDWFWDTLVDADPASNPASWQWVAGSGADAAPYFRIFNPIIQGQKFDPNGDYIRQWIPELRELPTQYIHAPWTTPETALKRSGITLGSHYPKPLVDHDVARAKALKAFEDLKGEE
jgi:deoxyribodipyrimidine photo-lyase